jgi:hypothetical protein
MDLGIDVALGHVKTADIFLDAPEHEVVRYANDHCLTKSMDTRGKDGKSNDI